MSQKIIKEMFENVVHIGHRTHKWNPKMKKFIYGSKNEIHIIDLTKTVSYLEEALKFMSKTIKEGKTILFVSTKPQSIKLTRELAQELKMPYVVNKWIPGLLTNFPTVKKRIKYLLDLKEQKAQGEFEKYTKKEASQLQKQIDKLEASLGGVQNLTKLPDAVFVLDVLRDSTPVLESNKLSIPVIGLTDTNVDPDRVDYPIPGNDDALKSIVYFIDRIKEALK